jgi:putative membrane protein insertion efficiency factor
MIARLLVLLIRGYQRALSPLLGNVCRFSPSCSQYMLVCIQRFGALRGVWLGSRRLARCHPFHPGGIDLPPEAPARCAHNASLPARSLEQRP